MCVYLFVCEYFCAVRECVYVRMHLHMYVHVRTNTGACACLHV